jgi:hypothetical protein
MARRILLGCGRAPSHRHGSPHRRHGLTLRKIARESGISTGSLWVGTDAFLPGDDETLRWTRAWLAWCELGRSEPWLADTIAALHGREREALAQVPELKPGEPDLDVLVAVLDGLRFVVCAPIDQMPLDRARDVLRAAAADLPRLSA